MPIHGAALDCLWGRAERQDRRLACLAFVRLMVLYPGVYLLAAPRMAQVRNILLA